MNIIVCIFIFIFAILIFSILIQIINILYNIAKKRTLKLPIRIIVGVVIVVSIIFLFLYGLMVFAVTYEPEHIIERDGKRMVAYVDSFFDVNVYIYDYINPFVRGKQLRIYENYGSGGYDPFNGGEMPTVKQYIYYDENGKVIKSSYMEN